MKKPKYLLIICLSIISIFAYFQINNITNKKVENTKTIKLIEVVHSIFYAPQYIAIEKNFFKEEGINIDLTTAQGADKAMASLISKNSDIALMGIESSIYIYNQGKSNYAINFAKLTNCPGNYLISREEINNFTWDDVKGKTIIGGRPGGMPEMVLEYILKKNKIDPIKDVEIINNLQFTSTASAFSNGLGDFTLEFEPTAFSLEQKNKYHILLSMGKEINSIPYTSYISTKSYIENNPDIIQSFTNAIYKAQIWIYNNSSKDIAKIIKPYFPENTESELEIMIDRYLKQNTWSKDPTFDKESFELVQDIIENSKELTKRVPFEQIINNSFAQKSKELYK